MTREYKPSPEQMDPTELVSRKTRPITPEEKEEPQQHSPSSVQNLRICKSPSERDRDRDTIREREKDKEKEEKRPSSVENVPSSDCGASDMTIHHSNSLAATCSSVIPPGICRKLSSPLNSEPLPGPSNLPPVQQVPLVSYMFVILSIV